MSDIKKKRIRLGREVHAEIRKLYAAGGHSFASLGARYGVAHSSIQNICKGIQRPDRKPRPRRRCEVCDRHLS